jgi:hypothetical protein
MATIIGSYLHAAVKANTDGTILARSGLIESVTPVGPGICTVELVEGVGDNAEIRAGALETGPSILAEGQLCITRLSEVQYRVRIANVLGDQDSVFNLAILALTNRS